MSTGGKTVFGGQIVRTEDRSHITKTFPGTFAEQDEEINNEAEHGEEMNGVADQDQVAGKDDHEAQGNHELGNASNNNEVDPFFNGEDRVHVENNIEVGDNRATENNQAQVPSPQQPNLGLLQSIVQQAIYDQQAAIADEVQTQQSIQQTDDLSGAGHPIAPPPPVLPALWMWVMNSQARVQVTQGDINAAHQYSLRIEEYMEWRVGNNLTPAYWLQFPYY